MTKIAEKIDDSIQAILLKNKMFTNGMTERVKKELLEALDSKTSPKLDKKDVEAIAGKLTINGNNGSLYTWLHQELFNRIVVRLRNQRFIECPFIINTASKSRRDLIIFFTERSLENVPYVKQIMQYLLEFKDCGDDPIVNEEVDIVCAYIASSILFSHAQFPSSYKALLELKRNDISFDHDFIDVPLKDEPVFYRYHLSFHSVIRLNRAVTFFRNKSQSALLDDGGSLFHASFKTSAFPALFRNWLMGVLRKSTGEAKPPHLSLRSFIEGARCIAVVESFAINDRHRAIMPCFLHSVQTQKISCYSYPDYFLSYLLPDYRPGIYSPPPDRDYGIYQFQDKVLESLFSQITLIRRTVYKQADMTAKKMLAEIERIPEVPSAFESELPAHSHQNAKYFTEWFVTRYRAGTRLKTLNDYSSMVASFIDTLGLLKITATDLTDDDLVKALQLLKQHYQSRSIKSRIRDFMEFVTSEYGSNLSETIWKKKGAQIKEIRTQKPFIGYELILEANNKLLWFLAARQIPSGNKRKIEVRMQAPALIHKAKHMKHAYCLSYYTGMRRDEVYSCTVKSIRYDDGPILVIEEGKTSNSERVIPLFLLLPEDYLSDFENFVDERRRHGGPEAYLFVRENGEQWNAKEFFEDIQDVFVLLGIPDYSFHDNRGSFGSWFLLRWAKVFHKEKIPKETPFLKFELFQDKYDERFKQIFWGNFVESKDPHDFNHALFILARILGHGGPAITLERYVHSSDWVYKIFQDYFAPKDVSITAKQAANLAQISYSKFLRELKARNIDKISQELLLRIQREHLNSH